jgi:hypothetical protein
VCLRLRAGALRHCATLSVAVRLRHVRLETSSVAAALHVRVEHLT